MEKLLQVRIDERAIEELDRKCGEYGISRRGLLELFIKRGRVEVVIDNYKAPEGLKEVVMETIDKSKYATDSNIVGGNPISKKSLRNTFKIPQKSESPNNPKSSNFISFE